MSDVIINSENQEESKPEILDNQLVKEYATMVCGEVILPDGVGELLLDGRRFIVVQEQLLFVEIGEDGGANRYFITKILPEQNYSAEHYAQLPENSPFQLINSKLIYMPSPFDIHQKIAFKLTLSVGAYVEKNNLGAFRFAPLDVHFDKDNVYQPDLLFVSVARKDIVQNHIKGAPDWVVEILSKSTADVDKTQKMAIYGQYNVLEYWLIHPEEQWIEVYVNESQRMKLQQKIVQKGTIISTAIKGFSLEVADIFV